MKKKEKEKTRAKPKYGVGQNVWFMVKLAWTTGEKKVLVLCLLSALLAVALNLINLYISPAILSAVERHVSLSELAVTIAVFVAALMLVSAADAYVKANTAFGRITVRCEILNLLNRKAATTSYPNIGDDGFQKLLAKALEGVAEGTSAAEAIWQTLANLTSNSLGLIFYAGLLTAVQPVLIVAILATTAVSYAVTHYTNGYGYRHREEEAEISRQILYLCGNEKMPQGAKDIRIFGLLPWLESLYDKSMAAYAAFQRKAQGVYLWGSIADLVMTFLRNGLAYFYLIGLVLHDGLSVAEFLLFFTAVSGFSEWTSGILKECSTLYKQSLDLSTVQECLAFQEPFRFAGGVPIAKQDSYEIRLERVSFRYPGADKDTLTNIDLTLHPGEKLAVVGLNGAGKTTLIKLICGFLDPTEGRVLLNGQDIRTFNRQEYYALFSAVFQNFSLLAGTIALNVAQTETDVDMERVRDCVDKAGLREKIESLPEGYETRLNRAVYEDAIQLSGGETQRLMLARALYKDAPFVVLDEPTAALDPIAESELYQKYHEMTLGKSSIYISHRLASTRFCDRILLIDQGGIREEGTHEALLRAGGRYAALYEMQSKYYKEGDDAHGQA